MTPDERQRKEREQALRLMAAIVESSDDAIFSQNWDGAITTWNHGSEQLLGYSASEALGRSEAIVILPEHENVLPENREKVRRGERVEPFEAVWRTKEGRRTCVSISVSPVQN